MKICAILYCLLVLYPCQAERSWLERILTTGVTLMGENADFKGDNLHSRKLIRGGSVEDYYSGHSIQRRTKMGKGKSSKGKGKSNSSTAEKPQLLPQSDCNHAFHHNSNGENSKGGKGKGSKGNGKGKGKGSKGSGEIEEFTLQRNGVIIEKKSSLGTKYTMKSKGNRLLTANGIQRRTKSKGGSKGKGKGSKGKGSKGKGSKGKGSKGKGSKGKGSKGKGSKGKGSKGDDPSFTPDGILCSDLPSKSPVKEPVFRPDGNPSPTQVPTAVPTIEPVFTLDNTSKSPTKKPSVKPTVGPTVFPTANPTTNPTSVPTSGPTKQPTVGPTTGPTSSPTSGPTKSPSSSPTFEPTFNPTTTPTNVPTKHLHPTHLPTQTDTPTNTPSSHPTSKPSHSPTRLPTGEPTRPQSLSPTNLPTSNPTVAPSAGPTTTPTSSPTSIPTKILHPTHHPTQTDAPTTTPSKAPTMGPTINPTTQPTSTPTRSPTNSPTGSPTRLPTGLPTASPTFSFSQNSVTKTPTHSPTSNPTSMPSPGPTMAPTNVPTGEPTSKPTIPPSPLPTHSPTDDVGCEPAFVYCSQASTCFLDDDFNNQVATIDPSEDYRTNGAQWSMETLEQSRRENAWGWSIFLGTGPCSLTCGIYIGAIGCDTSIGQHVGTAKITSGKVELDFDGGYESTSVQIYAGHCVGNDAGKHMHSNGNCNEDEVALYAAVAGTYPFRNRFDQPLSSVTINQFSPGDRLPWDRGYNLFPLASATRRYITIAMNVCPVETPTATTVAPTALVDPDGGSPTTTGPTMGPSPSPTQPPELTTTLSPTKAATVGPTPSAAVGTEGPTEQLGSCSPAYVYCPCSSTCFLDPNFNQGALPGGGNQDTSSNAWGRIDEDSWGWNIALEDVDAFPMECEIWMDAVGCSRHEGFKVGTVEITQSCMTFTLNEGYVSNSFRFYGGSCEGFNGGANANFGYCNPTDVADWAASPEDYPFVSAGDEYRAIYHFNQTNTLGMFPLDTSTTKFMTGFVEICEEVEVETGSPTSGPTAVFDPAGLTGSPSLSPSSAPSSSARCSANPVCEILGLEGYCCPSTDGVMLDCCDPPPLCEDHPACAAEGLQESCCPTETGVYLDCCMETFEPSEMPSGLPSEMPSAYPSDVPSTSFSPTTVFYPDNNTPVPTTSSPTGSPTTSPTINHTSSPTKAPTRSPTTTEPTEGPTSAPVVPLTDIPTQAPVVTFTPTSSTKSPTTEPTQKPTPVAPTYSPTSSPTAPPTDHPTHAPVVTLSPTSSTESPTAGPTFPPTASPTLFPSNAPTTKPSNGPTKAPVARPTEEPTSSPTSRPTQGPTGSPISLPTLVPTAGPTLSHTSSPTNPEPTIGPTSSPTSSPSAVPTTAGPTVLPTTSGPTGSPTTSPTINPTSSPTMSPLAIPTTSPTIVFNPDSNTPAPTEPGCVEAWVWCPSDTSTCFEDSNFNGNNPGQSWGWSINVDGESGLSGCTGCEIWANSNCDRTAGVLVGMADFDRHYATISMKSGYAVSSANLYGGSCEGSDGGDVASNHCACKPSLVAAHSNDPSSFPIQKTFMPPVPGYTFTDHDEVEPGWTGQYYSVFPLGSPHRTFASMHLEVCPCPASH